MMPQKSIVVKNHLSKTLSYRSVPIYAYVGGGNLQVNKHAPLRIKVNPNVDSLGSCLHGALFSVHVEA